MSKKIFDEILLPYDGSRFSKKALEKAVDISKRFGSRLHLLTVVNLSYIQPPGGLLGMTRSSNNPAKRFLNASRLDAEKALSEQTRLCKIQEVKADYSVRVGNITEQILKFAKQKKITLIIIGSQGLHGFGKLKTLGSTSRKVSELANYPVLIIR
ncbi:MAG: universal stress protein [Nitrosopumilaceae archaeon]|nr:universal stress protein [Nitrosopumilaceae archaeon]